VPGNWLQTPRREAAVIAGGADDVTMVAANVALARRGRDAVVVFGRPAGRHRSIIGWARLRRTGAGQDPGVTST
jgi:hypothetical protein